MVTDTLAFWFSTLKLFSNQPQPNNNNYKTLKIPTTSILK